MAKIKFIPAHEADYKVKAKTLSTVRKWKQYLLASLLLNAALVAHLYYVIGHIVLSK